MSNLLVEVRNLLLAGADREAAIQLLRDRGCSKVESIRALAEAGGLSLATAKYEVHHSAAWSDVRDRDDAFHDALVQALEDEAGGSARPSR